MTRLRRLLHALGFHWWGPWRTYHEGYGYIPDIGGVSVNPLAFQRRHCRVPGCDAEERRVRDTKQD